MNILKLRNAALFVVMYFCCTRCKEASLLTMAHLSPSVQGTLSICFQRSKTNTFQDRKSSILAPVPQAGQFCPVKIILSYYNTLQSSFGSQSYLFPSFSPARVPIKDSRISYSNSTRSFWTHCPRLEWLPMSCQTLVCTLSA